jgi:hypothetical protein
VNDQKHVVVKYENDSLADAPDAANDVAGDGFERRLDRAKNERTQEGNAFKLPADDVPFERLEINDNVWKFWRLLTPNP